MKHLVAFAIGVVFGLPTALYSNPISPTGFKKYPFDKAASKIMMQVLGGHLDLAPEEDASCFIVAPRVSRGVGTLGKHPDKDESARIECKTSEATLVYDLGQEVWFFHGSNPFPNGVSFEGETAKIIYEMMANSYTAGSEPVLHWYEVVLSDGGHIYLWRDFQIKQRMSVYTERGAEKLMNRFACGYENTFNPTEGGNQESSRSYRCEIMEKYNYYVVPLKV